MDYDCVFYRKVRTIDKLKTKNFWQKGEGQLVTNNLITEGFLHQEFEFSWNLCRPLEPFVETWVFETKSPRPLSRNLICKNYSVYDSRGSNLSIFRPWYPQLLSLECVPVKYSWTFYYNQVDGVGTQFCFVLLLCCVLRRYLIVSFIPELSLLSLEVNDWFSGTSSVSWKVCNTNE